MSVIAQLLRRQPGVPLLAARYPKFDIGVGSYGNAEVLEFGEGTTLKIGNYCSLADGVQIMLGGGHRTEWVTTYPFSALDKRFRPITGHPVSRGDVVIGHDVWVGREAMILSGVAVGNGAVIGARAVVARDVAPYAIVAGNPARSLRLRFTPEQITRLEALAWWHWPRARIEAAMPLLLSENVERLIAAVAQGEL